MARALWKGTIIAESDDVLVVDGYTYFPAAAVRRAQLRASTHTSVCGWKGTASYFDVVVGNDVNANAAWVYETPKEAARAFGGWIAFWKGVEIQK